MAKCIQAHKIIKISAVSKHMPYNMIHKYNSNIRCPNLYARTQQTSPNIVSC